MLTAAANKMNHKMLHVLKESQSFDFQFGRILACHLLGQNEKLNWKECLLSKDEEIALCDECKLIFK